MTYNYCTLFDSFFLSRGLVLYDSLKETTPDFKLYIFPFDEKSETALRQLALEHAVIVPQREFETPELLKIKSGRSKGEYCWTCTPVIIEHCLQRFGLPNCTYIDADLYFFGNANVLVDEMGEDSVMITDHRYTPRYDQSATSGKYCVQFMTFRDDDRANKALTWWKTRCLEWCYDRIEDGKFGDQKYLDDWLTRFDGIHELKNEGAGLAPWNIQQYRVRPSGTRLTAWNQATSTEWPVIFYHFHAIKFLVNNRVDLGAYRLNRELIDTVYRPYLDKLSHWNRELLERHSIPYPESAYRPKSGIPVVLHKLARRLTGVYYVFNRDQIAEHGAHS